ncbi:hypothetical protein [Acetomicrobium sp.]|uniref:hypothetical protein n=1 Tax=Acetomicrobium sp. TaxID=1872099 RepID=UPI003D999C17
MRSITEKIRRTRERQLNKINIFLLLVTGVGSIHVVVNEISLHPTYVDEIYGGDLDKSHTVLANLRRHTTSQMIMFL